MALQHKILAATAMLLIMTSVTADQAGANQQNFDQVVENFKGQVKGIAENIQNSLGIPDLNTNRTELYQTFVNQTKVLGDQVQDFLTKVHAAATDKDGLLAPLITQLNETATVLHSAEFEQKTKGLKDTVTQSMNTIADNLGKVAAEFGKESKTNGSLYDISQNTLNKLVEISQTFEARVKAATEKKQ